jgi:hypothetical protein
VAFLFDIQTKGGNMELKEFMSNRVMSKDGTYYYVTQGENIFIQPVSNRKNFKLPKELKKYKEIAMWKIGPSGKTLKSHI